MLQMINYLLFYFLSDLDSAWKLQKLYFYVSKLFLMYRCYNFLKIKNIILIYF